MSSSLGANDTTAMDLAQYVHSQCPTTGNDDATTTTADPQRSDDGRRRADDGSGAAPAAPGDRDGEGRVEGRTMSGSRRRSATSASSSRTRPSCASRRPGRPKHAALLELSYGISLYAACVFLPSLPHHARRACLWGSARTSVLRERALRGIWICWRFSLVVLERWGWMDDPYRVQRGDAYGADKGYAADQDLDHADLDLHASRPGHRIRRYIFSTSTASLWEEFNRQHQQRSGGRGTASTAATRSSAHPSIPMILQDVQILVLLAVLLAMVRVWFVHMLVPEVLAEPKRLEAMTRCKSSHLLSSSNYQFEGPGKWEGAAQGGLNRARPDRKPPDGEGGAKRRGPYGRTMAWVSCRWYRLRPSVRRALGHEPSARYGDAVADRPPSPPRGGADSPPGPARDLFSAPRRATATFRLLYTSASCLSALALFRTAEFWPRPVGGTHLDAGTRRCWDLGGSFSALGFLDDDYDARNGKLKYFFLCQAAYQLHSLCFHVVSMLLLLLYGGDAAKGADGGGHGTGGSLAGRLIGRFRKEKSNGRQQSNNPFQQPRQEQTKSRRLISMKTSMQSYFRPMVEHVVVLALLVGAYLFSGLRRLGAVVIFTLELSSIFLQLLQVSIYAPEKSWWRKPEVVLFVHRMLTVPTFVYCRLVVLPFVLWRSALFESQEWLDQIAKVFSPVWAERLYAVFNGLLCLIFALNLVLFRRLLFHPHLKQIVKQRGH